MKYCNTYRPTILVGKPQEKTPLGRSRHRWEGNIRIDLREIYFEVVKWIELARDSYMSNFCGFCDKASGNIKTLPGRSSAMDSVP
jgi:hypothetical protein